MRKHPGFALLLLSGSALLGSGCSTMNNTERGALTGTAVGGVLGTVVGAATGHPLAGAAIGAGSGAVVGGAIGNSEDRQERREAQAYQNYVNNPATPVGDVIRMSQQHISDDIIIRQIETTNSVYQLTAGDITVLRQQGVSERVVGFMQTRRPGVAVVQPPPPGVVYVQQPPPVAVGVGLGFGGGYGRRGCW